MVAITAERVHKNFGSFAALGGVDLDVRDGELLVMLGASGSGKTTMLRVLAGLEFPDRGHVRFDGRDVTLQAVRERRVGFLFQSYALFSELDVFENVAFGLRALPRKQRPSGAKIEERVRELLSRVRLTGLEKRLPRELSGGQQQRVALARALAIEPSVLMLDEPFSALDPSVRSEVRAWFRALATQLGVTVVLVTHGREEALELADRIAVLADGKLLQIGTPTELFDAPADPRVAQAIGDVIAIEGSLSADGTLRVEGSEAKVSLPIRGHVGKVRALTEPRSIELRKDDAGAFTIERAMDHGDELRLHLRGATRLRAHVERSRGLETTFAPGTAVRVIVQRASVFERESGERLLDEAPPVPITRARAAAI